MRCLRNVWRLPCCAQVSLETAEWLTTKMGYDSYGAVTTVQALLHLQTNLYVCAAHLQILAEGPLDHAQQAGLPHSKRGADISSGVIPPIISGTGENAGNMASPYRCFAPSTDSSCQQQGQQAQAVCQPVVSCAALSIESVGSADCHTAEQYSVRAYRYGKCHKNVLKLQAEGSSPVPEFQLILWDFYQKFAPWLWKVFIC